MSSCCVVAFVVLLLLICLSVRRYYCVKLDCSFVVGPIFCMRRTGILTWGLRKCPSRANIQTPDRAPICPIKSTHYTHDHNWYFTLQNTFNNHSGTSRRWEESINSPSMLLGEGSHLYGLLWKCICCPHWPSIKKILTTITLWHVPEPLPGLVVMHTVTSKKGTRKALTYSSVQAKANANLRHHPSQLNKIICHHTHNIIGG